MRRNLAAVCSSLLFASVLSSSIEAQSTEAKLPESWLVRGDVTRSGRSVIHTDAVELALVTETWRPPSVDEGWKQAAFEQGKISIPRRGYAWCRVESTTDQVMLLRALGHSLVYVDGEPRAGDHYRAGISLLPIRIRAGGSELLFRAGRGALEARLEPLRKPLFFTKLDTTLPDVILGQDGEYLGAAVVVSVSRIVSVFRTRGLRIRTRGRSFESIECPLASVASMSARKVPFRFRPKPGISAGKHRLTLQLLRDHPRGKIILDNFEVDVRVVAPGATHKRTFTSAIDGSVQYYAVTPSTSDKPGPKALFLSLHGASVEASAQAASYAPKSWGHVVAPTNRRPYGFDWEFIGRLDALEVLADAKRNLVVDPSAVYLTGHSMGGHGTWQVGVTHPNLFAAIGPSAGWCSFATYGRGRRSPSTSTPMDRMLQRAASPSDTLLRKHNYAQHGVYVLHGDADRTVPVSEARDMRKALASFHHDVAWHEQAGAGHWWDDHDEPGAGCVDFAPMFDFFARRRLPVAAELREVDFSTVEPAHASRCHWVEIRAQQRRRILSRVRLRRDPAKRRIVGQTENVLRMALWMETKGPIELRLDGRTLRASTDAHGRVLLQRSGEGWVAIGGGDAVQTPEQSGPFQEVFRKQVVFAYGTRGSAAENAWAHAKARFDAETLWYRGNASIDVVPDSAVTAPEYAGRNIVLYGNEQTNSAWGSLLGTELRVRKGSVSCRIEENLHTIDGTDIACVFVRPRPGSSRHLVAGIGGTGLVGMRLTNRFPYFVSGVHYPDVFAARPSMLTKGKEGIVLAGFFSHDWRTESGEFVWQ